MAEHTFDEEAFRAQFPAFASTTQYPSEVLLGYWSSAVCALGSYDTRGLSGDCRQRALYLMTAHLAHMAFLISIGQTSVGVVTGATIDKVTVSMQAPAASSGWQSWLYLSPYGMQLWAMLSAKAVGGFYVGGLPERDAFRSVYGIRGGGRIWR